MGEKASLKIGHLRITDHLILGITMTNWIKENYAAGSTLATACSGAIPQAIRPFAQGLGRTGFLTKRFAH